MDTNELLQFIRRQIFIGQNPSTIFNEICRIFLGQGSNVLGTDMPIPNWFHFEDDERGNEEPPKIFRQPFYALKTELKNAQRRLEIRHCPDAYNNTYFMLTERYVLQIEEEWGLPFMNLFDTVHEQKR
jgi:hypothetical protein